VRQLETALRDKRVELEEQLGEKALLLARCEKLEARLLQSSESTKQQARNSSLAEKLKQSNAVSLAAAGGNVAQQKRLLVIKNKVLRAESLNSNRQSGSTPNGQQALIAGQASKVVRIVNNQGASNQPTQTALNALRDKIEQTKKSYNEKFNAKKVQQTTLMENVSRELQELKKE